MSIPKWVVKDVQATENHELLLTFMDGKKGIFDFLPQLQKPFYEKLKNILPWIFVKDGYIIQFHPDFRDFFAIIQIKMFVYMEFSKIFEEDVFKALHFFKIGISE